MAALIIYHDVLGFQGSDEVSSKPTRRRPFASPILVRPYLFVDWAVTEWVLRQKVRFEWPEPPCVTFFDYDRFRSAWNRVIKSPDITHETRNERVVEKLVFAWISAGTAVISGKLVVRLPPRSANLPWTELTRQLEEMASLARDSRFTRGAVFTDWLLRVIELLMPEMGVPQEEAPAKLSTSRVLKQFWTENSIIVHRRRAERLAEVYRVDRDLAESLRLFGGALARDFVPDESLVQSLIPPEVE